MFKGRVLPLALALLSFSCDDSSSNTPATIQLPTQMVVDPADFLGNVPCLNAEGAMQSYFAVLYDVTAGPDLDVAIGPPAGARSISCSEKTAFSLVTAGNEYVARIWGFKEKDVRVISPDNLQVADSVTANSAQVAPVEAAWQFACGMNLEKSERSPTVSIAQAMRVVTHCVSDFDNEAARVAPRMVRFDFKALFGAACAAPNDVDKIRIFAEDASTQLQELSCAALETANLRQELPLSQDPQTSKQYYVATFGADNQLKLATNCHARLVSGITVAATCDLPTARGALSLPFSKYVCRLEDPNKLDPAVKSVKIEVQDRVLGPFAPADCQNVLLADLRAEPTTALVTVQKANLETHTCTATVAPGRTAVADCQ